MNRTTKDKMLAAARRAAARAYAPYSDFPVGAAVLDEKNRIHSGCNVENSSLGLTICAERNAVARAVCAGAKSIKAVLVFTDTDGLTPPCGACLQVIAEFGGDPEIVLANRKTTRRMRLKDFLPRRFGRETS
jgi:cytidine deaminase